MQVERAVADWRSNFAVRAAINGFRSMLKQRDTRYYFYVLCFIFIMGVVGPALAPYPYDELVYEGNTIVTNAPPSLDHPLGTTSEGHDVLSRLLYGARPTVITGLLGGGIIITIGSLVGVTAGYLGGKVENLLMRVVDFAYTIPTLPFAIVIAGMFNTGFYSSIFILGILLWKASARVLRSQVIQIKERPFILAARTTGASSFRIIFTHIFPNIAPMAVFFFALGVGTTILLQAGLAFIGVSNPFVPSWGIMVRNAYSSGYMAESLWWSLPPGILISVTVLSTFMFGRGIESSEQSDQGVANMG